MAVEKTFMSGRRSKALLVSMISSAMLMGCSEPAADVISVPVVRPALVEQVASQQAQTLSFNGVVQAAERADLAFRVSGRLTQLLVNEGDMVKKGQLLAQLDARDAQTALASAQSEFDNVQVEYARAKAVFEKSRAITQSDLDALSTRLNLAKHRVEEAQRKLEYTSLYSPFTGVVGLKQVDNHTQIQANQPILTLHNLHQLEVLVNIPDTVMLTERHRTRAFAELAAIPKHRFPLTLKHYSTQADAATQTYAVTLSFTDVSGYRVLPGMTVKVWPDRTEFDQSAMGVMTLPLTAVVSDNQGSQYVWVVNNEHQVHKRIIEVGNLQQNRIEINANLQLGETVVIAGTSALSEGMEVRPYTESAQGAM
ncbi:TPA: efflux RND transporter periplasmic adaptor subunit [Vibrio vulnificus]|nr:efflux RND transporter periplasmic adaptor subunit [Vibrio vulnificus]